MQKLIKVLSLFSGIGAFERALENLNIPHELVAYCEIDKYAAKAYSILHNISEDKNLGDVSLVDGTKLGKVDLICYGFPCQDISLAGHQRGVYGDTRSALVWQAHRIIKETMPEVAICENVKNLTGKKFADAFKDILDDLDAMGYNAYWQILNAKDYGVPQNRERVFIVSIRKDIDKGSFSFPAGIPLTLRLKDILFSEVDEKYYIKKALNIQPKNKYIQWDNSGKGYKSQEHRGYYQDGLSPNIPACNLSGDKCQVILKDKKDVYPINPQEDGMCRPIKAQYAKTSPANFLRTGTMGATGVLKVDKDE